MSWLSDLVLLPTKVPTWYLIVAVFVCGVVLFSPEPVANTLGLESLQADDRRMWFGLAFLLALGSSMAKAFDARAKRVKEIERQAVILARIPSLSWDERAVLAVCLRRGQSIQLPATHRLALALCQKDLLIQYSGTANMLSWPFTVPDHVWTFLLEVEEEFLRDRDPKADDAAVYRRQW